MTAATPPATVGREVRGAKAWLPSRRSVLAGLAILVAGVSLYVSARETSLFGIDRIEVQGVSPPAAARVRAALEPLTGSSLVTFDRTDGDRRLAAVPLVASASYDRDFPHTLRVTVEAEQPIALLRRGRDAWVVSARARVLRKVATRPLPGLPRIWLPARADPLVGTVLGDGSAAAVRALVPMRAARLPVRIRSIRLVQGEVSIVVASGTVVVFGAPTQLRLKLAVAARVLPFAPGARYLDVSVPERAVAGSSPIADSQVEG